MGRAKDIIVKPISAHDARKIVRAIHYSGKVDTRSQLHFGVFLDGKCGGAIQLGPPIDKRKVIGTVKGTKWNEMLDLHRLALADWLPTNGESRVIAYVMKFIAKNYPWIKWVQSYADATQCGDGTIYRASGFKLIGININKSMYKMPDGEVCCKIVFEPGFASGNAGPNSIKARYGKSGSETSTKFLRSIGAELLQGFQLRYIYFLHKEEINNLTVPIIPFDKIKEMGASMYKGKKTCPIGVTGNTSDSQSEDSGSNPTVGLNSKITNG